MTQLHRLAALIVPAAAAVISAGCTGDGDPAGVASAQTVEQTVADDPTVMTEETADPKDERTEAEKKVFPLYEPEKFETTASGLKYRIIREGEGEKPKPSNTVLAHYGGTLTDGTTFDSSYRRGAPIDFPLSGVIKGWTEGLQLIGKGGAIQLIIPGKLAYGPNSPGSGIPPNATLRFNVELIDVF